MPSRTAVARSMLMVAILASALRSFGDPTIHAPGCPTERKTINGDETEVDCHKKVVGQQESSISADALLPSSIQTPASATPSPKDDAASDKEQAASDKDFNLWVNSYTRSLYDWQARESIIIFFMVIGLVLAGIYFAWLQFQATLHIASTAARMETIRVIPERTPNSDAPAVPAPVKNLDDVPPPPTAAPTADNIFKIGKDGVAIQSSFVGLIILAISMGFFIMYLKFVYPIEKADRASQIVQPQTDHK